METIKTVLGAVAIITVSALIIRAIGAWMLRIDEIIKNQKSILAELQRMNDKR